MSDSAKQSSACCDGVTIFDATWGTAHPWWTNEPRHGIGEAFSVRAPAKLRAQQERRCRWNLTNGWSRDAPMETTACVFLSRPETVTLQERLPQPGPPS